MKVFLIINLIVLILDYIFTIDAIKRGFNRNFNKLNEKFGDLSSFRRSLLGGFSSTLRLFLIFSIPILNVMILIYLLFCISGMDKLVDESINKTIEQYS